MTTRRLPFAPLVLAAVLAATPACGDEDGGTLPGAPVLCEALSSADAVIENPTDLRGIEERAEIEGDLVFCSINGITDISLPNLTRVGGNVLIYNNAELLTVDLPVLTSMGESGYDARPWAGFLIDINTALTSLNAPLLRHIEGHIWLGDNAALTSIDFPALMRVGSSITLKSTALTTVDGFNELVTLGNGLLFFFNESLTDISGFTNLSTISNDLMLLDNPEVTSVSLPALRITGRLLSIEGSPKLATLDVPTLNLVGNNLLLDGTDMVALGGLSALEIVGNDLSLVANADLATLDLPALQSVGASLTVDDNDALTDLTLVALTLVGDDLHLEGNALLSTLDLSTLIDIGGNLIISTNAALPTCAAEALRDTIGLANIGGAVSISGNDNAGTCP